MVEREHARQSIQITKKEEERAAQYGGVDSDWKEYTLFDSRISADKGSHKLRSIYHAPQHLEHWRKVEHGTRT